MSFARSAFESTLDFFTGEDLLSSVEAEQVVSLLDDDFEFADVFRFAESVHVHVEADSIDDLPHAAIRRGARPEHEETYPDMIKYGFQGGLGVIFSDFTIAQDDLIDGAVTGPKPYVDHLGVDLRDEGPETRAAFESIPTRAGDVHWRHVHQASPLYCCYVSVGEKHWVYPPEGTVRGRRPIEFAFGELKTYDTHMGCDYRPIDPGHPLAGVPVPARTDSCH